jgi:transposase
VISQAIRHYALELAGLHTDTTSLKVYGAYERDEGQEGPLGTCGDSRDHRPDLKQLLFGLVERSAAHGADAGAGRGG